MNNKFSMSLVALSLCSGITLMAGKQTQRPSERKEGYRVLVEFTPDGASFVPESVAFQDEQLVYSLRWDDRFRAQLRDANNRIGMLHGEVNERIAAYDKALASLRQRERPAKRQRRLENELAWGLKK